MIDQEWLEYEKTNLTAELEQDAHTRQLSDAERRRIRARITDINTRLTSHR